MAPSFSPIRRAAAPFFLLALAGLLARAADPPGGLSFRLSPLPFRLENAESGNRYAPEAMPGGAALFDYDGDGDLDIFFANGAPLPEWRKSGAEYANRLLRNDGGGKFRDATEAAGLAGAGYDFGAAVGDYDNDGDPDLFVAGLRRNTLYRNDDGRFVDVSDTAGLGPPAGEDEPLWSVAGVWFDYDLDGRLDLFVVNYLRWTPGEDPVCGSAERRDYCHPDFYEGTPNQLYRNRGDGTFEDVSAATGVAAHVGKGMGAVVADFDRDGYSDLFVTNDKLPNFLFRNEGGQGFAEIAFEAAAALPEHGNDVSGMGLDARDLSGDGLPDIVYAALPGETFPLLINTAEGYFEEATAPSGLATGTREMAGYSAVIADFDNDGRKDLFFSRGDVLAHAVDAQRPVAQPNAVFRQLGDGSFRDVSAAAGLAAGPRRRHRGTVVGDVDGDGRLDLVVTALGAEAQLWRNDTAAAGNWVAFDLEGTASNRDGVGAEIRLEAGGRTQHNHKTTSVGYASSSAGPVHFGLGEAERIDAVEVRWPSGRTQRLEDLEANRVIAIREPPPRGRP